MSSEKYIIRAKSSAMTFEFISEGPKGLIKKRVQYQKIDEDGALFNLAFGDISSEKNKIDDKVVSNNGDTEKFLATVASTLFVFMKKYPHAIYLREGQHARKNPSLSNRYF